MHNLRAWSNMTPSGEKKYWLRHVRIGANEMPRPPDPHINKVDAGPRRKTSDPALLPSARPQHCLCWGTRGSRRVLSSCKSILFFAGECQTRPLFKMVVLSNGRVSNSPPSPAIATAVKAAACGSAGARCFEVKRRRGDRWASMAAMRWAIPVVWPQQDCPGRT